MTMDVGTPMVMAPELLISENDDPYTIAVDVYAYAMLLYQICTRSMPWALDGKHAFTLFTYVSDGKRPDIPRSVPANFRDLITACWSHNPSARPTFQAIVEEMVDTTGPYKYLFPAADVGKYRAYLEYVQSKD
jgi:serine/threonine protein kinase